MKYRSIKDRRDGWRVTNLDSFFLLIPQVMRTRLDSQVCFEEEVPLESIEHFVRRYREEIPGLNTMHVIVAALLRMFSQRPCVNRFIVHNKIYAHKDIAMSIAVKRSMTDEGEETTVKPTFDAMDTIADVVRKINDALDACAKEGQTDDADATAKILGKMPVWLLRIFIRLIFFLDNHGIMPKALGEVSPWHTSAWVTNVGSIGLFSVYHHLYEFGTASVFVAIGKKSIKAVANAQGEISAKRMIGLKCVVDERICDGYYYATSMKLFAKLLAHPEIMLTPPAERKFDPGVIKEKYAD